MECYIGDVFLFAFNFAPQGFALCDGATLNISQYQALFSLIGVTYGGNGSTTFAVPNMLGAEPAPNLRYYIAVQGYYPPRT